MTKIEQIIKGLEICRRHGYEDVASEHECLFAGGPHCPELEMEGAGWHYDGRSDCWGIWT